MTTEEVCKRKKQYSTRKIAKRAVRVLKNKGRILRHYKCEQCGFFHLTRKVDYKYRTKIREDLNGK